MADGGASRLAQARARMPSCSRPLNDKPCMGRFLSRGCPKGPIKFLCPLTRAPALSIESGRANGSAGAKPENA
jgi:hypothetical protein